MQKNKQKNTTNKQTITTTKKQNSRPYKNRQKKRVESLLEAVNTERM